MKKSKLKTAHDQDERFRKQQRQFIKAEIKQIETSLLKKLEKAFVSGAIPEHWKEEGNHLLSKAVIHSFCLDKPYEPFSDKKETNNLHLFL